MKRLGLLLGPLAICLLALWGCGEKSSQQPVVLMISVDGFRWDYIEKYQANNLAAIAENGVRAEKMRPVYPTKTFPNHLSIVTGLYPVKHGIVDNHFYDKQRQQYYRMGDGQQDSTWISGIPIWNLAQMNGLRAATYFWPESDARINGMTPDYFYHYSHLADDNARVEQILDWLKLPEASRPQFIAGYFSMVDTQGHRFGPNAPQTAAAVATVDGLIGRLRQGIKTLGIPVNLIILADHGMTEIDPQQAIDYKELPIDEEKFIIVDNQTRLAIYAKPETSSTEIAALKVELAKVAEDRYQVLTEDYLKQQHFWGTPRVADIILGTDAPKYFTSRPLAERHGGGTHGYAYFDDMGALFVAEGPAFNHGVTLAEFDCISVYPLIAHLLGSIVEHPIDGSISPLLPALKAE